ncbi:MAG TPA: aminopeptidase [Eubacteriaceae bacterium]|jgi:aminopeptidase|nr:aminopeptidase [Eubacteriaceae bacterium]
MDISLLENYAQLIIKIGLNIQKNQTLVITSPIEGAEFVRIVGEVAFNEGARDVVLNWGDEKFSRMRFLKAPEEVFEEFPQWKRDFYLHYIKEGAAFLSISASDPELFMDVDPSRMAKANKTTNTALREYRESIMSNKNTWCVASIPTLSWAKKVFPHLPQEKVINKLWSTILKAVRIDGGDFINQWKEHNKNLRKTREFLNNKNFKTLHYKNSLGTDLTVELPKDHIWLGGSEFTPAGIEFNANIPTEEVFTLPKKTGVNGKVVSTKPLNYNGNLIEDFSLRFKEGKIIDFTAEKGYETLKNIIETDEGSYYLGEVALVPYDSPISNLNILFYNTLFDENASCHFAFGKAYPVCLKDGQNMNKEELKKAGVNDSLVHTDFMIGSRDLEIVGTTWNGDKVEIFKNGNFVEI